MSNIVIKRDTINIKYNISCIITYNNHIVVGCENGSMYIYDINTHMLMYECFNIDSEISCICAIDNIIINGTNNGILRVLTLNDDKYQHVPIQTFSFIHYDKRIVSICATDDYIISADKSYIHMLSRDPHIMNNNSMELPIFKSVEITNIHYCNKLIECVLNTNEKYIWNTVTNALKKDKLNTVKPITAFHKYNDMCMYGTENGNILKHGKMILQHIPYRIDNICATDDLLIATAKNTIKMWNLQTNTCIYTQENINIDKIIINKLPSTVNIIHTVKNKINIYNCMKPEILLRIIIFMNDIIPPEIIHNILLFLNIDTYNYKKLFI